MDVCVCVWGGGGMCVCVCDVCRGGVQKNKGAGAGDAKDGLGDPERMYCGEGKKKGEKIVKKGIVTVSALDKQKKRGVPSCLAKKII